MRTIKFRVWDSNFKTMVLANDIKFVDGEMIGAKGVNWDSKVEVVQFTGLKDRHGKEIYDKDLVKICFTGHPDAKVEGWKYKVEAIYQVNIGLFETTMDMVKLIKPEMMIDHIHFGAEDYWWDGETFKIDNEYRNGEKTRSEGEIEVIGNIYENKDLLT